MTRESHTMELVFNTDKARANAASLDRQMGSLQKTSAGLGSAMTKLAGFAGGLTFAVMIKSIINANVATEKMVGTLAGMTGSMEKGRAAFEALNDFALRTPFSVDQATNAFVRMRAVGIAPTERAMNAFGNIASAMGLQMDTVAEAVASAAQGSADGLRKLGINAQKEGDGLRMTFQGVSTHVGKSAKEITQYLIGIGETKFGDAMANQAELLPQKLQEVKEAFGELYRAIGSSGANDIFISGLEMVADKVMWLADVLKTGFAIDVIKLYAEQFVQEFTWAFDSVKTEFDISAGFLGEMPGIVLDAFILLPSGIKMVFTMMFATVDAFIKDTILQFQRLLLELEIVAAKIEKAWDMMWGMVKVGAGDAVDWIKNKFADLLSNLASDLPEFSFFKGWADDLNAAAEGIRANATAGDAARDALDKMAGAYDKLIAKNEKEIRIINEKIKLNNEMFKGEIAGAAKELNDKRQLLIAERERLRLKHEQNLANKKGLDDLEMEGEAMENLTQETFKLIKVTTERKDAEEKAGDALMKLMGRLDPAIKKEQELAQARDVVNVAAREGILNEIQRQELLAKLPGLLEEATDKEKTFSDAIKSGTERIDAAFADMWLSFMKDGKLSMDSLLGAFQSMMAEMIQMAARPITLLFQEKMQKSTSAFGQKYGMSEEAAGGWMAAGMIGGTMIGNALGGGGEGAQLGSSLGAMVGGAFLGPVGALIGGALGGLAGGMFDDDPKYELQLVGPGVLGNSKLQGRSGPVQSTALGGFAVTHATKDVDKAQIAQITEGIAAFDRAMAAGMDKEQIAEATAMLAQWGIELTDTNITLKEFTESRFKQVLYMFDKGQKEFIENGYDFADSVKRMAVVLKAEQMHKADDPLLRGFDHYALLSLTEMVAGGVKDITETFDMLIEELLYADQALSVLADYGGGDLLTNWAENVAKAGRTLFEVTKENAVEVSGKIGGFDGTLTSIMEISQAVQQRYALEFTMLSHIADIAAAITDRFQSLRDMILTDISTDQENMDRYWEQMNTLGQQLETALDPDEINRLAAELDSALRSYWAMLTPEQQAEVGPAMMEWIAQVDALAQERLEAAKQEVLMQSEQLRAEVMTLMDAITGPMMLVAAEHGIAAADLQAAAAALWGGATGAAPGGDTTPVGDAVGESALPEGAIEAISTASDAVSIAAVTLQQEGEAYRSAAAEMASTVLAAAKAIPDSIPVYVRVTVDIENQTATAELV